VVRRTPDLGARRALRVLVLCHDTLVPPRGARGYSRRAPPEWRTEFDVLRALRALGHETRVLGAQHDVEAVLAAVRARRPDVVFNLLVEFHGQPGFDQHVEGLEKGQEKEFELPPELAARQGR